MSSLDDKIAALKAKQGIRDAPEPPAAGAPKKAKKAAPKTKANGKAVKKVSTKRQKATENYELFSHAYIRHGCNATGAYTELHPDCTPESAATMGWRLLRNVEVQRILFPLLEALMEKNAVDTEFVLNRWLEQANGSALDYFHIEEDGRLGALDLTSITDAQRRNLKSIKISDTKYGQSISITVADQQKAVEMFAKYLQMLTEKAEPEDADRIGDLIEAGVKRIRANKDLNAWKDGAFDTKFSDAH